MRWLVGCRMVLAIGVVALAGCQTMSPSSAPLTAEEAARAMSRDTRVVDNIAGDNAALRRSFLNLRDSGSWRERGYFSAEESDHLEAMLFRFHTAHQQLGEISDRYAGGEESSEVRTLQVRASDLAQQQSAFLVTTFAEDAVAQAKLNQAYPRSEIPRHTYDTLAGSLRTSLEKEARAVSLEIRDDWDDASFSMQADLFLNVSRLKKPTAYVIRFNDVQKGELFARMQPGDLLLTYTGGYASDVFIPGAFKHGITYVGTPAERRAAGLGPERILKVAGIPEGRGFAASLDQETTLAGRPANLIEAVGEGVKFSNLEFIMDTHISRLVVVRPRLGPSERTRQLGSVFSYLGQDYDFRFDFADSSRQVCTEVIYRSLNGMDGIDFPLTSRGGHVTLSADDLIRYWLEDRPEAFEFVLFAEEKPRSPGHGAGVLYGAEGKSRLVELMREEG